MSNTKLFLKLQQDEDGSRVWLETLCRHRTDLQTDFLKKIYAVSQLVGSEQLTLVGLTCFQYGLEMAEQVAALKMDSQTIAAALLYPAIQYHQLNLDDIREHAGEIPAKLIDGMQQMEALHSIYHLSQHQVYSSTPDNLRRMLLAIVDDVRVVIVKLVKRLVMLRHLKNLEPNAQLQIAQETMDIYAPLANHLGIGQLKWELEDLAFSYISPAAFQEIIQHLDERREDRQKHIQEAISLLKIELHKLGLSHAKVYGRAKHIYSIWRKKQRKNVSYDEIYDISAVRVVVNTIADCYNVLGVVHSLWHSIPSEFDDYIVNPKVNGYRSIHTAVIGPSHYNLEVQIRTEEMHNESELGIAAHWIYKEGETLRAKGYESKILLLRKLLEWQQNLTASQQPHESINASLIDERVYVFTPQGAVIDLPQGATVLDFAYYIHSELGHRCRGAKVNDKMVPLSYVMSTGDRVEIMTSRHMTPSRDWLNANLGFLKTSRARSKVHHWFKQQDLQHEVQEERSLLERKIPEQPDEFPVLKQVIHPKHPEQIIVAGVNNILTYIARCCRPIPGDTIVGYITKTRGISVHRSDCSNIKQAAINAAGRFIHVCWSHTEEGNYSVELIIYARDRSGLIRDISAVIAHEKLGILAMTSRTNAQKGIVQINLTFEVATSELLQKMIHKIGSLPDVEHVFRRRD